MLKSSIRIYGILFSFILLSFLSGCVARWQSAQPAVVPEEVQGSYTLLLHGGQYYNDLENIALLDREDDEYTLAFDSAAFRYVVKPGMQGPEAVAYAKQALMYHPMTSGLQISRLTAPTGQTIGYVLIPQYWITEFGYHQVIDVWYTWRDKTLLVHARLKPDVHDQLEGNRRERPFLFRR
ncbi:MAG TPA: hypothetical protein VK445_12360 [Dissulfurispiraceae bacterium]|nr:hypothetical protein [Dissulfurispiraceae bacterium]